MAHRLLNHAQPAAIALYLTSNLLLRSFTDIWLFIGFLALCAGMAAALITKSTSRGPKPVFYGLLALLGLHALAIPGSLIWGTGNWELTAGVLLWMAPAVCLYLLAEPYKVLRWMAPVWIIHGGIIIWVGFTNWRAVDGGIMVAWESSTGLANNMNLAGGFAALGMVYFLRRTDRLHWLALPLLAAVLFTGSRWGVLVALLVPLFMALSGATPWRVVLGAAGAMIGSIVLLNLFTGYGYALAGVESFAGVTNAVKTDVGVRLALPHIPSFLPSGIAEHPGLHNVPLRVAVETGIVAAALWAGITLWALVRRRNGVVWWMLLALVLLSMLDYYTWMGHLGGFWWLLVGGLVKTKKESEKWQLSADPKRSSRQRVPHGLIFAKRQVEVTPELNGLTPSYVGGGQLSKAVPVATTVQQPSIIT